MNKPPKQHKCKECGGYYVKSQSTQQVCSMKCAIAYSKRKAEEKRKKQEKSDRLEAGRRMRARKEALKSRSDWRKLKRRLMSLSVCVMRICPVFRAVAITMGNITQGITEAWERVLNCGLMRITSTSNVLPVTRT